MTGGEVTPPPNFSEQINGKVFSLTVIALAFGQVAMDSYKHRFKSALPTDQASVLSDGLRVGTLGIINVMPHVGDGVFAFHNSGSVVQIQLLAGSIRVDASRFAFAIFFVGCFLLRVANPSRCDGLLPDLAGRSRVVALVLVAKVKISVADRHGVSSASVHDKFKSDAGLVGE
jgi:hypothetical protein